MKSAKPQYLVYEITFARSARKELENIPIHAADNIFSEIEHLAETPRPHGVKKLKAAKGWRIRIGDYRIIYEINDRLRTIVIGSVRQRSKGYD